MKRLIQKLLPIQFFLSLSLLTLAQDDVTYKTPPKDMLDMLMAKAAPGVSIDDRGEWMLLTESNSYPSVEELARPELKIAGLRINPANYAPSRQNFINNLYLKNISSGKEMKISGLPNPLAASNISWSPDDKKIAAFVGTHGNGTSFVINNLALLLSEQGIKTAIIDLTKNKNSYYIFTQN